MAAENKEDAQDQVRAWSASIHLANTFGPYEITDIDPGEQTT
jgi:hypothetical protein